MDPDAAGVFAARLLERPHKAVASAVALWTSRNLEAESLASFLAGLPVPVERGGYIPPKDELDAWAREHTFGLITEFPPFTRIPEPSLLLASALVTKVTWLTPFTIAPAADIGERSEWSRSLSRVLRSPNDAEHRQFITRTARAGDVAVHCAHASDDLLVTSVIADPGVAPADVLAAAHEIATKLVRREQGQLSLFDLSLGDTALWTITEREVERSEATEGERRESYTTVIPSWQAHSSHDLAGAELGFEPACAALAKLARLPLERMEARQSAMARYTRVGFQAAAVTMMSGVFGRSRFPDRVTVVERRAELRFGHPFAVVAVTRQDDWKAFSGGEPGAWNALPVFYAWVCDPMDAEDEPDSPEVAWEDDEEDEGNRDDRDEPRNSVSGRDRALGRHNAASGIGARLRTMLRQLVLRFRR